MIPPSLMLRRPSSVYRYFAPACGLAMVVYWCILSPARLYTETESTTLAAAQLMQSHLVSYHTRGYEEQTPLGADTQLHPIEELVRKAQTTYDNLLARQTCTLNDTAAAYRERRGRHPPPGFDLWYDYAADNNVVVVEEFWDQIYNDLHPFWGLPPQQMQHDAYNYHMKISVRNGTASTTSDWFWTKIWLEMIQTIEHVLPDMDIPLNALDEPRMVVPWEEMSEHVKQADRTVASILFVDQDDLVTDYQQLDPDLSRSVNEPQDIAWESSGPYWDIARRGCDPMSATRQVAPATDFSKAPVIRHNYARAHMHRGYVANATLASDICHQPDIQTLNGIFIEPLTISSTKKLFPLFGGSKLSVNNEILLPAPMYWAEEKRFSAAEGGGEWEDKHDGIIWRGVATGGLNRPDNWRGFQRHRFVAMNNATTLAAQGRGQRRLESEDFAAWVKERSDCGFVDLMCEAASKVNTEAGTACPYVDPYYSVVPSMELSEQTQYKYLPDIDGNSFSGRYLAFLRSCSLPIKATVWREWHDPRLIAWKHYVPMDTRFSEWFGIMEFFLGGRQRGGQRGGRDDMAKRIAVDGKAWAERVLRKEDMQVYVLRLLLEYARVSNEKREQMGWIGDLR